VKEVTLSMASKIPLPVGVTTELLLDITTFTSSSLTLGTTTLGHELAILNLLAMVFIISF